MSSAVSKARSDYIKSIVKARGLRSRLIFHRKNGRRAAKIRKAYIRASRDRAAKKSHYTKLKNSNTPRVRAVKYAASILGAKEVPAYSNKGPQVTPWQRSFGDWLVGQPWCGVFVGVILRHVGVNVNSRIAAVAFIEDDAKAGRNGFKSWKGNRQGRAGDVAVLFGRGIHAGLILSHDAKLGGYWVAEGNTSSNNVGSQSNGGGSYRRFRSYSQVYGIAVPRYKGE